MLHTTNQYRFPLFQEFQFSDLSSAVGLPTLGTSQCDVSKVSPAMLFRDFMSQNMSQPEFFRMPFGSVEVAF